MQHRRIHSTGRDGIHSDVFLGVFQRGDAGQLDHASLARAVGSDHRETTMTTHRGVVHDATATLLLHHAQLFAQRDEKSGQIRGNDIAPIIQREIGERFGRRLYAGVVEGNVYAPVLLDAAFDKILNLP